MKQYHDLMQHVLDNGVVKTDRTRTGTISVFGHQSRYDLTKGFPLLTTKKLHTKSIIHELLWFLQGDTNIKYLKDNGVSIWDAWADENGNLGPVYGSQWRSWPTADGKHIDQIKQVIDQLKNSPDSRRMIVSAWNVAEINNMKLPPCHAFFQFYTVELTKRERNSHPIANAARGEFRTSWLPEQLDSLGVPKYKLSCQLYQRSADIFLGVPFNIASYALLTMMVAQACNMVAGEFIHTLGDAHLYSNHIDQAKLQLTRDFRDLPIMKINPEVKNILDFKFEDFTLEGYDPHPHIKASVAV